MVICRGLVMTPMGPAVEVEIVQGVGWKEIPDGICLHITIDNARLLLEALRDSERAERQADERKRRV